jgi:hypothetical protein
MTLLPDQNCLVSSYNLRYALIYKNLEWNSWHCSENTLLPENNSIYFIFLRDF